MESQNPWAHRWHHPNVKSFYSPIHGLGVVATGTVLKGEIVFVYGGCIMHSNKIKEYWNKEGDVGIQVDDNFFIVPSSRDELEREGVINHSCNPNVGFKDQIELIAMRDIKVGEEICFDYAMSESLTEPLECKCGSADCRRVITKDDWQNKTLQKKYQGYFSPYLRAKIG